MELKALYTEGNKPESVDKAEETRKVFLDAMKTFLAMPTNPVLSAEQKKKITDKVEWLLANEFRPTFWRNLDCQLNLRVIEGVVQMTPKLLVWAEYRKQSVPKVKEGQTIPHAKNGKIIRSAKGLS
jgi:hypothetical protein